MNLRLSSYGNEELNREIMMTSEKASDGKNNDVLYIHIKYKI